LLTKMLQEFESNKEISYWYLKKPNTVVQVKLFLCDLPREVVAKYRIN